MRDKKNCDNIVVQPEDAVLHAGYLANVAWQHASVSILDCAPYGIIAFKSCSNPGPLLFTGLQPFLTNSVTSFFEKVTLFLHTHTHYTSFIPG
jgi:hypothetical protein